MFKKLFGAASRALRSLGAGIGNSKAISDLSALVRTEFGAQRMETGALRVEFGALRMEMRTGLGGVQKEVRRIASSTGVIFELACRDIIDRQFGARLGAHRVLCSAEDVAAVVSPEGHSIVPSTNKLVATLVDKELGVLHLASYSVRKVQDLASGKEPTEAVVAAANELRAMRAHEQLAAGAAAATTALEASAAADGGGPGGAAAAASAAAAAVAARVPVEACMAVVRQLHRSGVGSMVFAADMERYLLSSPEQHAELLAGGMFMPCLSAVAVGTALPQLELDRCGRVLLEAQLSGSIALLHIGELKVSSGSVRDARKQIVRSATTLAWAYHALRSGGGGGGAAALPQVLDVRAHIFTTEDGRSHSRSASKQLPAYHREERLSGHHCPLTVYLNYYTLTPSGAKRWEL